jgi:hypothetical protein
LPLDAERFGLLQKLRQIPPDKRTAQEQRLVEDLEHQHGVSSVADAIEIGGARAQPRVKGCPKCGSPNTTGRTTPTELKKWCLDCGNKWSAAVGATLQGASQPPTQPVPVRHLDYFPSGGGRFRLGQPSEED